MFVELKNIGVRLALDDFGTGYSSLAYLKNAPFDKIKIDQSFVRGATVAGSRNSALIAAIVALAQALDMETTAEGIESIDQLDLVRGLGVSHIQGYVYSPGVPDERLREGLADGEWVIAPTGPAKQREDRQSIFRKAGAIHGDHCYGVIIRNISPSGALMEGLVDVPVGTQFVVDFGDGQLAVARVRRSEDHQQGIEFEEKLVSDGNGSLCTRHRISQYTMALAGLPSMRDAKMPTVAGTGKMPTFPAFKTARSAGATPIA